MGPHSHPLCRDGTTDITRTVHWGTPTPLQKVLALWGAPNTMGPGGCPAHHHAQPPHSLIGSLHPCADGQHRPLPPRLPIGHSWWVWSPVRWELGRGPTAAPSSVPPPHPPGRTVETFARRALWEVGLNYGHGTGHGIGNFLSVHECKHWGWDGTGWGGAHLSL